MSLSGERIGRIRITERLGAGGMGEVYGGIDETLGRRVAVKVIHARHRLNTEARARLTREAQVLSQLDHPNICKVFDYVEGDESDYLVLERVEGRVLREVVSAGKLTFAERLAIAESIAAVLVEAHRRGVIHRDLKPENVMIATSGEVKVLDFGLARVVTSGVSSNVPDRTAEVPLPGEASDADDTAVQPGATPPGDAVITDEHAVVTRWGSAIGTPRYMSPEQARATALSPASDMFAFGLLLQFLFTGEDAYGDTWDVNALMIRAAHAQTGPIEGVDHEVTALIRALEQPAPTDRPTAAAALARLRSIIDRPRRRAKRLLVAALCIATLAAGAKYTWDLRRERASAEAARLEAQKRRGEAEELVGFMLGDLRKKLEPLGRLDVLDEAGTKVLDYYAGLDLAQLSPDELARNAKALTQLGEVRVAQGKLPEATKAFEKSLELANAAWTTNPSDPALRLAVGTSHFWIGNAARMEGDLPKALAEWRKYLAIAEELSKRYPKSEEYELERAYGHGNVGLALEGIGKLDEALGHYRRSLEIKQRRLDRDPMKAALRADVAASTNKVGGLLLKLGQATAAREAFEKEVAIRKAISDEDPAHMKRRDLFATSLDYLATALVAGGDLEAAKVNVEAEFAIRQELVAHDPENVQWLHHLGIVQIQRATVQRLRGDVGGAATSLASARRNLEQALDQEPNRPIWKRELAQIDVGSANVHLLRRDSSSALRTVDRAIVTLAALDVGDPKVALIFAEARLMRGDALAATRRDADANAEWRLAEEVLSKNVVGVAEARALDCRARLLFLLGRDTEAKEIVTKLSESGYRHPDLLAVCRGRGC
ncbi:MAG: protein kinase [Acidobacteria bacterium]|nr:protein kinase [Acidobacteriota bacterium]